MMVLPLLLLLVLPKLINSQDPETQKVRVGESLFSPLSNKPPLELQCDLL